METAWCVSRVIKSDVALLFVKLRVVVTTHDGTTFYSSHPSPTPQDRSKLSTAAPALGHVVAEKVVVRHGNSLMGILCMSLTLSSYPRVLATLIWIVYPTVFLPQLRVRKVHLGVLLLELLENVQLLLLVACWLALLLLLLVIHHLLDHTACLAVEIAQLAVLGRDLGGIDLGRRGNDVSPPFHLVHLVEMDGDFLFRSGGGGERPGGLIDTDGVGQFALSVC